MMQSMTREQAQPLLVAVSGGIDSVVLLHLLATEGEFPLVVAHVDHGIRQDSADDERFVKQLAAAYGVPFRSVRLELGLAASEDMARRHRYAWLEAERISQGASAIVTAHHQDDVIETIIINLLRGTGWRGLASLRSTPTRYRPLLSWSKAEVVEYALRQGLEWRDDYTNDSPLYLRNRVRSRVMANLSPAHRRQFLKLYDSQVVLRPLIDTETERLLDRYSEDGQLRRYPLQMIDSQTARELIRGWLGEAFEQSRLEDLLLFAKTARPGAKWSLDADRFVVATMSTLVVLPSRD